MKNLSVKLSDFLALIWLLLAMVGPFWTVSVLNSRVILSDIALLLFAVFAVFKISIYKISLWWPLMAVFLYGFVIEPSRAGLLFGGRLMAMLIVGIYFVNSQKSKLVEWLATNWVLLIVILGLLQVTFMPDSRWLLAHGFDEHLGRAHGTLLDPTFYGLLSAWLVIQSLFAASPVGVAVGLAGTTLSYSRLSWLALAATLMALAISGRKTISLSSWIAVIFFIITIIFSPKDSGGLGHNVLRTNTITMRAQEVDKRIEESKARWVLGNGWSKLTLNGFDNGYIALWSATGVVGILLIVTQVYLLNSRKCLTLEKSLQILLVSLHSLGAPTFFYPWILVSAITFLSAEQQGAKQEGCGTNGDKYCT